MVDSGEKKWPAGPWRCLAFGGERKICENLGVGFQNEYTHMLHQNGIFMHMWLEFLVGKCIYMYRLNILYMEHLGYSLVGLYFPVVIGIMESPII